MEQEREWTARCPLCEEPIEMVILEKDVGHPLEITCLNCGHVYSVRLGE
jgi:hypothetical protein